MNTNFRMEASVGVNALVTSKSFSTSFELGLEYGGSSSTSSIKGRDEVTTKKDTYVIPPNSNFWICQQIIPINQYGGQEGRENEVMTIFGSALHINGDMC